MRLQFGAMILGLSAWVTLAAAAPEARLKKEPPAPPKDVNKLIRELSDDSYRVRESASSELWALGRSAQHELEETAAGNDPEQVFRANDLLRKIKLDITPETDPAVAGLVERYTKASSNEKSSIFQKLRQLRAWRQLLKLYAGETNAETQARLQRQVSDVAIFAARESLQQNQPAIAREYLELAPVDAANLVALAEFHRTQGTLAEEMKKASELKGARGAAWRLALARVSGNLVGARDEAKAAGEDQVSAAMSALLGDPIPWLQTNVQSSNGMPVSPLYSRLAVKRWQGKSLQPADLDPLVRGKDEKDTEDRSVNSLFQLGETALAVEGLRKRSASEAFAYFDTIEAVPEALKSFGLDPEKPDYTGWVAKRFQRIAGEARGERGDSEPTTELVIIANFLEARGLTAAANEAFLKPLADLAAAEPRQFTSFLTYLFGGNANSGGQLHAAPELARNAATAWAGDDADRWLDVLDATFGSESDITNLWDWLAELDLKTTRADRYQALLALLGSVRDPQGLREKWLGLAWEEIRKAPEEKQMQLLMLLQSVTDRSSDVANSLKIWDMLPESARTNVPLEDFTAAGRWDAAAKFSQDIIEKITQAKQSTSPLFYAYTAAFLRKAGHAAEAEKFDALVEQLALGMNSMEIANAYSEGEDFVRAAIWWERAVRLSDPASPYFMVALAPYGQALLDEGKWQEAASIAEIRAQCEAPSRLNASPSVSRLQIRLQADLARAMAMLPTDRAGSIALLDNCLKMFPSDGSLADDFFPALRKVGLLKEHDEWFQVCWDRITGVLAKYPAADNTANSAAWLAARAQRKLDEAEKFESAAIAARPNQSAYLDTMGEIEFARGNRAKAVEWSEKAVNFMPKSTELRQQRERFRTAPLPH